MVKNLHLKGLVALAVAFATSMGAYAATPISDAAGLKAIGNDLAGEYELTADITLTGEWIAIGTEAAPFTGTLNGNGHTISGLSITDTSNDANGNPFVGLFGYVKGGTIKNLSVLNAYVYGNEHVGIVAGRVCGDGVIDNVFTSGFISGRDHEGGIAGDAGSSGDKATVKNCMSAAYVEGRNYQAGGIVGWTQGDVLIENNIFIGEAYVYAWGACGGIVGFIENGTTTVKNNVCAARKLVGMDGVPPTEEGSNPLNFRRTAGIAGNLLNDQSNIVAIDNLVSDATVIYNTSGKVVDQSVIPTDFNGIVTPAADLYKQATYTAIGFGSTWTFPGNFYPLNASVTLPLTADMIIAATAPEEIFVKNTFNTNPLSIYGRVVTLTSSDNTIATVDKSVVTFLKPGTVTVTLTTEGDAFCKGATYSYTFTVQDFDGTIATAADIAKMSENPQGAFVLAADIDMTGVEFKPIANFSGTLDGQGHWIRNLSYNNPGQDKAAFFASFSGAFIKNVGFEGANIVGNADAAAVVGETTSDGVISNVVVANSYIEGRDHVASIVGKLNGSATVINCISNAQIKTREYQAAGIVGCGIIGTIEKCIFAGTVSSVFGTNQSGIISLFDNNGSVIKNNLSATVSYTNTGTDGYIANVYNREVTLENNYTAEYSLANGVKVTCGEANSSQGATATMTNVRSQAWYTETLGFNFTDDWKFLDGGEGKMLPVLKWMKAPLPTVLFNLPSVDGANVTYFEGTEFYSPKAIMGSWGQSVTITQLNGEDYATIEDGDIYVGDENGMLPNGGGTATFKVGFAEAIADLFTITGRDTFDVNVSVSGEEKTISTAEDFLKIAKNPSGTYILDADIDLEGVEFKGFCNDGNSFNGTIDGAGHSVKNFSLKFEGGADQGLFGKTSNATLKNIAFTQFIIDGGANNNGANHVGLIGGGSATLENVAIVGTVLGRDHVGLVAGDADGIEMTNCYAVGTVEAYSQVGGYFGCTLEGGCTVENCLSNVNVSANFRGWAGGFIGLIDKNNSTVTIKNCVSIGECAVSGDGGPKYAAPFIAGNGGGETANAVINFSGNIYNSASTMSSPDGVDWPEKKETAEGGNVEPATAANPNALATQSTYTQIGWDFEKVWKMGEGEYKYPVLGTVTVTDFTAPSGIENVIADAEANVVVAAANGEIIVSGLGETSVITVYTAAGLQVASVTVNDADAAVAVPANGFYIVAVATDGTVTTAKVVVK